MKSKEELNALKEEYTSLSEKLRELSEDELAQVTGGLVARATIFNEMKAAGFDSKETWGVGPEGYDCSGLVT